MLFNSFEFLFVFFPLSYAVFLLAGRTAGNTVTASVVLISSLVFYAYWRPHDLPLLLISIAFNCAVGSIIFRSIARDKISMARLALSTGIAFNIGLIAFYKYVNFMLASLNAVLDLPVRNVSVELPLGISFFTFTQIAFLVDVWRRQTGEEGPLRYGLFVSFYPHLIAGPILRQSEMSPQFKRSLFGRPTLVHIAGGLAIFMIGLAKKVMVADPIGSYASPVYAAAAANAPFTFWEAWAGTFAYALQIYFDFSAYSDMAVGLGLLLGVQLPINFDSPYKASSIIEFWRRWHMTLSAFLRDYLYIPLGGNTGRPWSHYANIMTTMLLGGLWHGASWTFVLWGGLHGLAICANHAWRRLALPMPFIPRQVRKCAAQTLTLLVVVLLWVLFRAETFQAASRLYRAMFGFDGIALPAPIAQAFGVQRAPMFGNGLLAHGDFWPLKMIGIMGSDATLLGLAAIFLFLAVSLFAPNSQQLVGYQYSRAFAFGGEPFSRPVLGIVWRYPIVTGAVLAATFWVSALSLTRPSQFLYFNF